MMFAARFSFAADATFSKAKNHVYLVEFARPALLDVDFGKKTCHKIDLSKPCREPIQGVALSNAGFVLCSTTNSIWSYNPTNEQCVKVCDAPKNATFGDIAYDPKTENLIAIGYVNKDGTGNVQYEQLYILPKNANELQVVGNRYDEYAAWINHPIFSADGALLFLSKGDLWEGDIEKDDKDTSVAGRYGSLHASRDAPLAQLITENTSPASTGLTKIAISKNKIYGCYARMGGSGWGSVIRFRRPSSINNVGEWTQMEQVIASIETIAEAPSAFLCSSQDGDVVLFSTYSESDKVFLIEQNKEPMPVKIEGLTDLLKTE
jgi:hypothetical protein